MIEIICKYCHNPFKVLKSRSYRKYCGVKCSSLSKIGKHSGTFGKHLTDEQKLIKSKAMLDSIKFHEVMKSSEYRKKLSDSIKKRIQNFGYRYDEVARKKFSLSCGGKNHSMYGKHHSNEAKKNMRISFLKRIEKIKNETGKYSRNVGKKEKQVLDLQEQKDKCKILRNYNTGIGYVVDGYCKESNTVYEVYEPYHNKQVWKDLQRETEICNHLSCDFIILWEK